MSDTESPNNQPDRRHPDCHQAPRDWPNNHRIGRWLRGQLGNDETLAFWIKLFFCRPRDLFSQGVTFIPNGPYGGALPASTATLEQLERRADEQPTDHVRLLPAFAVAHDPPPRIVGSAGLPLPMGRDAPNAIVFGRSGAGKTEAVVFPAILHGLAEGWSVVAINVKGRRQTQTLRALARACGRESEFQVVAPRALDRTVGYSPLAACTDLAQSSRLAESIVVAAGARSRHEGGAWAYNQAQQWLKFAIDALIRDLPPGLRTLDHLRDVILAGQYDTFAERHPNIAYLRRFARYAEGNTNGQTISETISECTAFIDEIVPFLAADELDLGRFAREGGVLVIEIDEHDIEYLRVVVTILLGQLLQTLQQTARGRRDGRLARKTLIAIDELAAAGPVPGLASALHTCRDAGFCFVAGTQSITQLGAIYGDKADVVLSGFQTRIALGGGLDAPTAEAFSRWSGMATGISPTAIAPDGDDGDMSILGGWQPFARPLLLPGDVANPVPHPQLGPPATVICGDGLTPPFQAYLTRSYQHGFLARLAAEAANAPESEGRRDKPLKWPKRRGAPRPERRSDNEAPKEGDRPLLPRDEDDIPF